MATKVCITHCLNLEGFLEWRLGLYQCDYGVVRLFKAQAMAPTSNFIFAVIILMFSVVAPATAGPLEDAVAPTHKGDYAAAHEFLRPLADNGDIRAQFNLGQLYANGWGVRRD